MKKMKDILEIACQKALEREKSKNTYFMGQSKKVVAVCYTTELLVGKAVVTFQPLEDLRFLDVNYLYSSIPSLEIFKEVGILKGLSVVQMPLVHGIAASQIAERLYQDYTPVEHLSIDPALLKTQKLLIHRWEENWKDLQGKMYGFCHKLGIEFDTIKDWYTKADLEC